MKTAAPKALWLTLSAFLGAALAALMFWLPLPGPPPDPDDVTVAADGMARAPRPWFGDCNSNGVIDLREVEYKPLELGAPETTVIGDHPTIHVRGDFNDDNALDLAVIYQGTETVLVLFNDGAGAFPVAGRLSLTLGSQTRDIAVGDFNNDNLLDLAVARAGDVADIVTVLFNDPATPGTFSTPQNHTIGDATEFWTIKDMVAVNLDGGDGAELAIVANRAEHGVRSDLHILSGSGDGSLAASSHPNLWLDTPRSITAADFDQDGDQDLAIGGGDWVILARNDGGGDLTIPPSSIDDASHFADPASRYYGLGYAFEGSENLAAADLNRDGYPELIGADSTPGTVLILPNATTGDTLWLGDDVGVRSYASPGAGSLSVADMDGDGLPDILVDGPSGTQAAIFLSQGDLLFEPSAYRFEAGVRVSRVLAVELDGVHPPELTAISSDGDTLVVFSNASRISTDCNTNSVPDACDVAGPASRDCNGNLIPDECDVAYQVGLSSRAVWKHFAYNDDWDVERVEIVEGAAPLLGHHFYDPVLWSADLDNDRDNELMVMNSWTAEYLRFLFNTDYGDFVTAQNPAELSGSSGTRLRNFLHLDLGVGFWNEKAIAMASGEFTGDGMIDLAIITLEPALADGRDVLVTALKIVQQGRSGMMTTWETRAIIYEQSNPRLPPMRHVIAADFDLDGDLDLAVTPDVVSSDLSHDPDLEITFKIVLLRNDGDGVFHHDPDSDITLSGAATSITATDLNQDDRPDIVVSDYSDGQVTVCHNSASAAPGFGFTGGCREFAAGSIPLAAKAGDLDGDGFPEIVVANGYSSNISVLHNSPVPGIDPSTDIWRERFDAPQSVSVRGTGLNADPKDLALVDLDLDGDLDVVTANWGSDSVTVLRNAGDGSFLRPMVFVAGYRPEALHVADLNRGDRPDIAVANANGAVTILLNRSRTPRSEDGAGDGRPDECGGS